jgi:hypothetical protein
MQVPPDGRIPVDRAVQMLSFRKACSQKDLDRVNRILDPGAVGSIPPSQLVSAHARGCCGTIHLFAGVLSDARV